MNQQAVIQKAIELTHQVIALAESGEWESFSELEKDRESLIQKIDTSLVNASESEYYRSQLQTLIELNKTLEQLCHQYRQEAMTELKSMKKGASAVQAYKK